MTKKIHYTPCCKTREIFKTFDKIWYCLDKIWYCLDKIFDCLVSYNQNSTLYLALTMLASETLFVYKKF